VGEHVQTKGNGLFSKAWLVSIAMLATVGPLSGQETVQVVSVYPGQNALHVPRNATITARFNAQMDPSTIRDGSFIVRGEDSGPHSGVISYESAAQRATFELEREFFAGEVVTVTLTNALRSDQGQEFKGFTWQFTVRAPHATPPVFTEGTDLMLGYSIRAVYTADLDGDEDLDIVAAKNLTSEPVVVLKNDGDGSFSQMDDYTLQGEANSISGNDLDNDGDIDLFASTYLKEGSVAVLFNDGYGSFPEMARFDNTSNESFGLTTVRDADIDNDGDVDLVYASGNADSAFGWVGVLENDGQANFVDTRQRKLRNVPLYLCVADLNSDGWLDLAVGMTFILGQTAFWNGMAILLNDGNGSFGAPDYYKYMLRTE